MSRKIRLYFRNTTYWVQDLWDIRQQNLQYPSCSVDISLLCQSRRYVLYTNPIYWVHRALENAEIMGYQAAKSATSVLFSSMSLCTEPLEPREDRIPPRFWEILFKLSSGVDYARHIFTYPL